ncbi:hypothetical protein LAZ67_X004352 [Cordylochernes scorpioides]|uniref:Uncharacterized protein n=1 Tax=Cordylochernes scorpioides TaxID=51811 RepID=A0ABY6LXJ7_9ARAC|nr:hypothetical protein LAZ67_X004352 [Cordylochernes scorpioides]
MGSMCFKASEGTGGRNSNWANAPNLVEIRIVQKPVAEEKKVMFSVLSSSFLNVPFQIDYVFAKYMKYVRNEVKTKNVMALGKLTRLPALEAARMGANVWLIGKEYSSDLEAALGAVEEKLEGTLTIERNVPRVSEMKAELGLLTWDYYFERRFLCRCHAINHGCSANCLHQRRVMFSDPFFCGQKMYQEPKFIEYFWYSMKTVYCLNGVSTNVLKIFKMAIQMLHKSKAADTIYCHERGKH